MNRTVITILLLLLTSYLWGQDPQNMPVEPQNTDCQELAADFASVEEAVNTLSATRFYYHQEIRTTRKSGLMEARFVSCNFKDGYLIILYDGTHQVYPGISIQLWEKFQQSADIDGFYMKEIVQLPKLADHE